MSHVLVLYATSEGQTARIAHRLAGRISDDDHQATTVEVTELGPEPDLGRYDAIVVGGSVHRGRHDRDLASFVRAHRDDLERVPSAFFSVSMAQANPAEPNQLEAQGYVDAFLEQTGWTPGTTERFAGALAYTRYNWLMRQIMKQIAKTTGFSTDTSRDHVYTDWDRVDAFATRVVEDLLEREAPARAPPTAASRGEPTPARP